mmetsp:Transcript_3353/g.9092  ORF Transcript_3353/g.9092 Transcript_3353/m.9092 type:complete len:200 (+) Transcript_3353:1419-2018(+)
MFSMSAEIMPSTAAANTAHSPASDADMSCCSFCLNNSYENTMAFSMAFWRSSLAFSPSVTISGTRLTSVWSAPGSQNSFSVGNAKLYFDSKADARNLRTSRHWSKTSRSFTVGGTLFFAERFRRHLRSPEDMRPKWSFFWSCELERKWSDCTSLWKSEIPLRRATSPRIHTVQGSKGSKVHSSASKTRDMRWLNDVSVM